MNDENENDRTHDLCMQQYRPDVIRTSHTSLTLLASLTFYDSCIAAHWEHDGQNPLTLALTAFRAYSGGFFL
jgi:hypothetical protein